MKVDELLRSYRMDHRLLQKEMTYMLGISLKHHNQLENGHCLPSLKLLKKICSLTQTKINIFFENELPPR